jgi:cytochrome c oxidase accessory protein FixG
VASVEFSPSTNPESPQEASEVRLYEKWRKIYPLWVKGGFQRWRRVVLAVLLLVFYAGPWLRWDGKPGFLLDLPARKFTVLWTTFFPQEFIFLSWLLIIAAFALFFFTVIAGRVWCGWACPQTVWTLVYVWIEKLVEGSRASQLRLDRGPWNRRRIGKKLLKWSLWLALAFSISITFVGYFTPIRELIPEILRLNVAGWMLFWLLFPAVGTFLMQGVLREQVCFHMCPYARFQSVMFDKDTLIISYDQERGDPRGSRRRDVDPAAAGLGACVDCKLCVHACPTGIDIRDGLQYQCIGCAACIDVCNGVMDSMGYAPNLIQYSSEHADKHEGRKVLRPRLVGYGAVLAAMLVAFSYGLSHRVPLELDVIRDRNRLYREHWDGSIENVYTLKIMNREQAARRYRISASGAIPVSLRTRSEDSIDTTEVEVAAGSQLSLPIRLVTGRSEDPQHNNSVEFTIETIGEPHYSVTHESRFLRPTEEPEPS